MSDKTTIFIDGVSYDITVKHWSGLGSDTIFRSAANYGGKYVFAYGKSKKLAVVEMEKLLRRNICVPREENMDYKLEAKEKLYNDKRVTEMSAIIERQRNQIESYNQTNERLMEDIDTLSTNTPFTLLKRFELLSALDRREALSLIMKSLITIEKNPGPIDCIYNMPVPVLNHGLCITKYLKRDGSGCDFEDLGVHSKFCQELFYDVKDGALEYVNQLNNGFYINVQVPRPQLSIDDIVNAIEIVDKQLADQIWVESCIDLSSVLETEALSHNREMHAMNGNQDPKLVKKYEKLVKKAAKLDKRDAKMEIRNEVLKEVKKFAKKKPLKSVPVTQVRKVGVEPDPRLRSEAIKLAKAITMPKDYNGVRIADEYSNGSTAVSAPFAIRDVVYGDEDGQIPKSDSASLVFRRLECATIFYHPNVDNLTYGYQALGTGDIIETMDSVEGLSPSWNLIMNGKITDIRPLKTPVWNSTQIFNPHGKFVYAGAAPKVDGYRFIWLEPNTNWTVTFASTFGLGSVNLIMTIWTPGGISTAVLGTATIASLNTNVTITGNLLSSPAGAYVAFGVSTVVTGGGNMFLNVTNLGVTATGSVWCHKSATDFDANSDNLTQYRIIGVSQLYTNVSSNLNKQGKIVSYQAGVGTHWPDYVTNGFNGLASVNGACSMPAETGQYIWMAPSQEEDFKFLSYTTIDNGVLIDSYWPLKPEHPYLITYTSITNDEGHDAQVTICHSFEYMTDNVWVDKRESNMMVDALKLARNAIRKSPNITENPLHWSQIWDGIKKGVKFVGENVIKYAPAAVQIAKILTA